MTYRKTAIALLLTAGLLAACSRSEPEQPEMTNDSTEVMPDEPQPEPTPSALPSAEPTPAEAVNAAAIEPPPEAPVAPDAQVLEDADATGMTARVSRDAPAATGNEQAPQ